MIPDAVIFDFDGVIIDTEPLHFKAFRELCAGDGADITWEDYQQHMMGSDDRDALRDIARRYGLSISEFDLPAAIERKARIFLELLHNSALELNAGVVRLLEDLHAREVPMGLCSGALASDIDPVWERWDLGRFFLARVSADHVDRSKPHPASYRLALTRVEERAGRGALAPQRTVAIEDTASGAQSARDAGLRVLGVHPEPPPALVHYSDTVVQTLEGVTPHSLGTLVEDE